MNIVHSMILMMSMTNPILMPTVTLTRNGLLVTMPPQHSRIQVELMTPMIRMVTALTLQVQALEPVAMTASMLVLHPVLTSSMSRY